jgi:hypothetical protein
MQHQVCVESPRKRQVIAPSTRQPMVLSSRYTLQQACLCSKVCAHVDSVLPVHNNPFAVSAAAPLM